MRFLILLIAIAFSNFLFSQKEAIHILSEYVKFKSISGNEKPAGQYIKKVCEDFGFYTHLFTDTDSSYNFCASLFPLDRKTTSILLINHIDVVPADDTGNWDYLPFEGIIRKDTIHGRGTLDMKGLAVMQMFALKKIKARQSLDSLQHNIVILFLSGEETGGKNGAAIIIEPKIIAQLNPVVVLGEGGGGLTDVIPGKEKDLCFFISNAEKKSLWIKLEINLKSHGHSSIPSSKTADKILLKAIQKIENIEERIVIDKNTKQTFKQLGTIMGGWKGFVVKHIDWWIFKPARKKIFNDNEALKILVTNSYQLTQIQNPYGPFNQVAQSASAYYDLRLLPNESEKPFILKLIFGIIDPRIKLTVLDESPTSLPTKLDMHYENIKKAINAVFPSAHVLPILFPATTDNSYFRSANIPSFGLSPFQSSKEMIESVHSRNEKLPTKAMDDGIKVYEEFLKFYFK